MKDDETVCIVASDGKTRRILDALRHKTGHPERWCATGKLNLIQGMETPEQQVEHILDLAAQTDGRLRIFGDMRWTRDRGWRMENPGRLERTLNQPPRPNGCLFLCQCLLDDFTGREIMMAIETHTHGIYRGQIKKNHYGQ